MKRFIAVLLLIFLISLTSCEKAQIKSQDLMQDISASSVAEDIEQTAKLKKQSPYYKTEFAVEFFKASVKEGENTLVSPLSVIYALGMTANGASGETLNQMEYVLGAPIALLNPDLHNYVASLPQDEKYKLNLANSIWFTSDERFAVNQSFLQTNADYYGADVFKSDFYDRSTVKDINNWVKKETDDMIPEIIKEIPEDAVMYLINALAFEAEWMADYEKADVREDVFTNYNGDEQNVEFMHSIENIYIQSENAVGTMKYFRDMKYAFVALLPNEDVNINDYIKTLNGEELNKLLSESQKCSVITSIPVFETASELLLNDVLKSMGMEKAFDENNAEFSGLGTSAAGNIFINRVIHKTFITVGPKGVKAGAATAVEMNDECATYIDENPKTVKLNRPFVYMLIDCETNTPFFVGVMNNIK